MLSLLSPHLSLSLSLMILPFLGGVTEAGHSAYIFAYTYTIRFVGFGRRSELISFVVQLLPLQRVRYTNTILNIDDR